MKSSDEYTSVTQLIEQLIDRENENIAVYDRTIRQIGDSIVKPVLLSIVQQKHEHCEQLEKELGELNEQFEIDEAIV